ncbi:MAG TPA: hypothetical protein DCP92_14090 [Nitrospiraceae bacterium]|jgi:hypothetical protein|nr:hypothetical protein [Nitrospiraceae bacterium]
MRTIRLDRRPLLALGLFVVILAGCAGSSSSKFYQLHTATNFPWVDSKALAEYLIDRYSDQGTNRIINFFAVNITGKVWAHYKH